MLLKTFSCTGFANVAFTLLYPIVWYSTTNVHCEYSGLYSSNYYLFISYFSCCRKCKPTTVSSCTSTARDEVARPERHRQRQQQHQHRLPPPLPPPFTAAVIVMRIMATTAAILLIRSSLSYAPRPSASLKSLYHHCLSFEAVGPVKPTGHNY